jgi:negative regulator of sigma E activity
MDVNDKKGLDLLEKWHSGDFTRADEQALQRLLANCDAFSREAIEGYLEQPETDHLMHLSNLRNRLAKKEKRPSNPWFFRLAVAASFLICVSIGTWWLSQKNDPTENGLAQETPTTVISPGAGATTPMPNADIVMSDQSLEKRSTSPEIAPQKQYDSIENTKPQADLAVNDLNESTPPPAAPILTEVEGTKTDDDKLFESKETESLKKAKSNPQKTRGGAIVEPQPSVGERVRQPQPPPVLVGNSFARTWKLSYNYHRRLKIMVLNPALLP